jgi:hypothetical protein
MKRNMKCCSIALVLGLLISSTSHVLAGGRHGCRGCGEVYNAPCSSQSPCGSCGSAASSPCGTAPTEPVMVEKTILVPKTEMETQTIHVTQYKPETRERTVAVMNRVPKTETVTRNYSVMVPKTETKTITYNVCKPVVTEEIQQYVANVPCSESREGTRKVCKQVASTKKRMVTVDQGHWEGPAPASAASGCGASCENCDDVYGRRHRFRRSCGSPCRGNGCGTVSNCGSGPVWVPNPVQQEVEYTAYENVWEDQKYTYNVVVMKPETRTRTVKKCHMVAEQQSREVAFTKCVPEQRSSTHEVTRYECVPSEKTVTYTVQVPYQVEKQIQVRVCKMVPKTILVPEGYNDDCGSYRRSRRCRGC